MERPQNNDDKWSYLIIGADLAVMALAAYLIKKGGN